jgi:ferric-dicitrate binding protein FerR (iron transport regulator)
MLKGHLATDSYMHANNKIWLLIGKRLSNSITSAEEHELEQLMRSDPEAQYTYEVLRAVWTPWKEGLPEQKEEASGLPEAECSELYAEEDGMDESSAPRHIGVRYRRTILAAAAIAAVIFAGLWGYNKYFGLKGIQFGKSEIVTRYGSKTNIVLPDGTRVLLNAGSRLTYSSDIATAAVREVDFSGEAYFEVKHDALHPFVIHTDDMDIRDIGTAFNVKSYPGDAIAEATLIEGSIQVILKKDKQERILLAPHEKITLYNSLPRDKKEDQARVPPVPVLHEDTYKVSAIKTDPDYNIYPETAWLKNKIIFRNQPFAVLAQEMERAYNVKISIESKKIREYLLTGIFEDETVQQALDELKQIAHFDYKIYDNKITIQ